MLNDMHKKLLQARKSKKLTREQVAEMAEISDRFLQYIEHGHQDCKTTAFIHLCKALEVEPWEIMEDSRPKGAFSHDEKHVMLQLRSLPSNIRDSLLGHIDVLVKGNGGVSK